MGRRKIFFWLQGLVMTFGGGGLFVVTFFDSSVLSFPFFPDAVLIELCIANHKLMPYYAAMAAIDSGAAQRTAAFPQPRSPAKASVTGTANAPAAMDLVQVYRLTRPPHGAWCGTS